MNHCDPQTGRTFALFRLAAGRAIFLSFVLSGVLSAVLPARAQNSFSERPVPILTGNAGYFTNVEDGHTVLSPTVNPVLLVPMGDHWLIEGRGEFEGDFERPDGGGPFGGTVDKELNYLQADYIANPHLTVTVGRFLTPFGMYNERLYPIWIRSLPEEPLIFPIATGSSDGLMFRGGFSLNAKANLNYSTYFSAGTENRVLEADRLVGGRLGFFFPGPRIEVGTSWQKSLQEERANAFGFHFAWQPAAVPLNLRSEYARSNLGSGYWIAGAYRLSQLPFWQRAMRHTEVVLRAQQFFAGEDLNNEEAEEYELPDSNARQADFGLNYYLRDGMKVTSSFGRQFSPDEDANLWTVGIAYRFALPLGNLGAQ